MRIRMTGAALTWMLAGAAWLAGQTQVDLRSQGKNIDFSAASSTKPLKTGNSLPATCAAGEAFFLLNAPAGQNWFGCVATSLWVLQTGGSTGLPAFVMPFSAQSSLMIDGSTHLMGTAALQVACFDGAVSGKTLPMSSLSIDPVSFDVTVTFDGFQTGRCVVSPAAVAPTALNSGAGVVVTAEGGGNRVAVDAAVVPTFLAAAQILDYAAVAAGTCSPELTMALPGATAGDAVAPGWPETLPPGLVGMMRVPAADLIGIRLCNLTAASVDPAPAPFRAAIVRSF